MGELFPSVNNNLSLKIINISHLVTLRSRGRRQDLIDVAWLRSTFFLSSSGERIRDRWHLRKPMLLRKASRSTVYLAIKTQAASPFGFSRSSSALEVVSAEQHLPHLRLRLYHYKHVSLLAATRLPMTPVMENLPTCLRSYRCRPSSVARMTMVPGIWGGSTSFCL